MNFVKSLDLFGTETTQIPSIVSSGAPSTTTAGAIGMLYMDTNTQDLYKCVATDGNTFTWKRLVSQMDWNQQDDTQEDFIKGKENVNATVSFCNNSFSQTTDNIFDVDDLIDGVYTSQGKFSATETYKKQYASLDITEIVPGYSTLRCNQKVKRICAYDENKNILTYIDSSYGVKLPEGTKYFSISLFKPTYEANTIKNTFDDFMLVYTNDTGKTNENVLINKPYVPKKAYNKTKLHIDTDKRTTTPQEFLTAIRSKVSDTLTIVDDVVTCIGGTGTKDHFKIPFDCLPTEIVTLEFYGSATHIEHSTATGAMFIVEFYDKEYQKIGNSKYNGFILGTTLDDYHKYQFVAPYGTHAATVRLATRANTSCSFKNVKLTVSNTVPTRSDFGVRHDAHLGVVFAAPRNTMPGFELAKKAGFTSCITNCNWTKDGVLVALHNDTIDETSNGTGNVHDMTYDELLTYDFGSWYNTVYTGTKIPKLEDVTKFMASAGMRPIFRIHDLWSSLDDEHTVSCLREIYSYICKYGFKKQATVKVNTVEKLHTCYEIMGDNVDYIIYVGNFGNTNNPTSVLNSLNSFPGKVTLEIECGYALAQKNAGNNVVQQVLDFTNTLGNKDIEISSWTVDSPAAMRELILMGVTRFCSDICSDIVLPLD